MTEKETRRTLRPALAVCILPVEGDDLVKWLVNLRLRGFGTDLISEAVEVYDRDWASGIAIRWVRAGVEGR